MSRSKTIALSAFLFLFSGIRPCLAIDGEGTVMSQELTRQYLFHAPGDSVAQGLPVVLVLHGLGETAASIKDQSGFDAIADLNGFLVVYPSATNIGGTTQWNAYVDDLSGHGGIGDLEATDDVIFLDDLIEQLCSTYSIDSRRIYATGFSNGGYMAYAIAVQRPYVYAAVAPVSASLWGDTDQLAAYFAQDHEPVGLIHIHGDADPVVPYPDPSHDPFADIWPLTPFALANCESVSYENVPVISGVEQLVFCNGLEPDTHRVEMIRLLEGVHEWPAIAGFDAAATIWSFFSEHSTDPADPCFFTSVRPLNITAEQMVVFPNPTTGMLQFADLPAIGPMLRICDLSGRLIDEGKLFNRSLDVTALQPGMYVLEIITREGQRRTVQFIRE